MDHPTQVPSSGILSSNLSSPGIQAAVASNWYNLTAWAVNVTRYAPFIEELVWAGPRMLMRLGSYIATPDHLTPPVRHYTSSNFDSDHHRTITVNPNIYNILEPNPSIFRHATFVPIASSTEEEISAQVNRLSIDGARGLGSILSYVASKWALSCVVMALLLNRTHVFAATRRQLRLRWHTRLFLRLAPILLLSAHVCRLLRSIQCQTSADFARLRWGEKKRTSDLTFSEPLPHINLLTSLLLLGSTDQRSCVGVSMVPVSPHGTSVLQGSLSILWPLFGTFCLSHLIETISCAVQGVPVIAETGMTLFEHSLAFAEADALVRNQLNWETFPRIPPASGHTATDLRSAISLTQSIILNRANTATEVLLVAFLSSMTHITSHILGVLNLQDRFRLASTGFWGLCFMGSIIWSTISFELEDSSAQALLRFPTVCIVGFVPHILVLLGIWMCLVIYGLALILSIFSPPQNRQLGRAAWRQRISDAHRNMQASVSLSDLHITRDMDFYTALLKIGFAAITMASEAVYLSEDRGVTLQRHTWLEEIRLREVEELQRQYMGVRLSHSRQDNIGVAGLIPVKNDPIDISNGYTRERAAQTLPPNRGKRGLRAGTGASDRSSRWLMALDFLISISKLTARVAALTALWMLGVVRLRCRPNWLLRLARRPKPNDMKTTIWNRGFAGSLRNLPPEGDDLNSTIDGVDIETEIRETGIGLNEESLNHELYQYWLRGGWWGSRDSSGDFEPDSSEGSEIASVASYCGTAEMEEGKSDTESDTSHQTQARSSRQTSNLGLLCDDNPLDMCDLARLLNPTTSEEREEAQALAAHFRSDQTMTRSAFRRLEKLRRARILTMPGHNDPRGGNIVVGRINLSADEEERALEHIILSRRGNEGVTQNHANSNSGKECLPCVICQSSSRTIIVWPCRCLSLCDDCRISLAMNNFDKCVCCRRDVMSFSRIFVP